jgi:hypothetical protein
MPPPAMSYAILRLSKLKNLSMATSATQHNYRLQDTPNANPEWVALNEELLNHGHRNYWQLANERIAELHLTRLRSDAVRAVELVLTGSPEGFRRDAAGRALDVRGTPWVQDNLNFVRERFGPKNVVSFTLHQDEVTPHIHAVVVPVTTDGRLSNRDVFSPVSLRQLQTDYAKAMAPHGFERGIKYSTAIHEDVRRHYGAQQMSKEALAEVAKRVPATAYQLRPIEPWQNPEGYQAREQLALDLHAAELAEVSNKKIGQLAAVASANALEHDRVRVLEKQLAHSQELLVKAREDLKIQINQLTQQLQQAQQELTDQKVRTEKQSLNHLRAVLKHIQGEPLSEKLIAWGQEYRQSQQDRIERILAKQLLRPLQQVADIAPAFLPSYKLTIAGPEKFTLTHEKNGLSFSNDELRPNGRSFLEQFREIVQRQRIQEKVAPPINSQWEMEI